jgi:predicted transcriptional regulator
MPRRNVSEMKFSILDALFNRHNIKLTHIVYKANINLTVLKPLLKKLIDNGLIREIPPAFNYKSLRGKERKANSNRTLYTLTPDGNELLSIYKKVLEKIS